MAGLARPKGPYGKELLWGEGFISRYRDALEDLYLTDEVRFVARDVYFAAFSDGDHSMNAEKRFAVALYDAAGFSDDLYAFRFIVDDVVRCGFSRNSALISIQAYMMLVETGVLTKPIERHLPSDSPVTAEGIGSASPHSPSRSRQSDETSAKCPPDEGTSFGEKMPSNEEIPHDKAPSFEDGALSEEGPLSEKQAPFKETSLAEGGALSRKTADGSQVDATSVERKCSNCVYYRSPDHCSQWTVCDDWTLAKEIPDYWPTEDDIRGISSIPMSFRDWLRSKRR